MKLDAGDPSKYLRPLEGFSKLRPLHNDILVVDMNFEEEFSSGGIYIPSDNGKQAGLRARWAQVYEIGPEQEDVKKGQWILVEHGRWTRGIALEDDTGEFEVRMVEAESVLAVSDSKPDEANIGGEFTDGQGFDINPEDFGAR